MGITKKISTSNWEKYRILYDVRAMHRVDVISVHQFIMAKKIKATKQIEKIERKFDVRKLKQLEEKE